MEHLRFSKPASTLGKGDNSDLRRAAEAKRQSDRTDASIDVELHPVVQPEKPVDILGSHIREHKRRQEGKKNLPSVSMSGENEVNLAPRSVVREVRLMRQQDERFVVGPPAGGQCGSHVGPLFQSVTDAGQPNALAVPLYGYTAVGQQRDAVGMQSIRERPRTDQSVVVPQNCVPERAFDVAKKFGATGSPG